MNRNSHLSRLLQKCFVKSNLNLRLVNMLSIMFHIIPKLELIYIRFDAFKRKDGSERWIP